MITYNKRQDHQTYYLRTIVVRNVVVCNISCKTPTRHQDPHCCEHQPPWIWAADDSAAEEEHLHLKCSSLINP